MGGLGLVRAGWTYCMARAYSLAPANVVHMAVSVSVYARLIALANTK